MRSSPVRFITFPRFGLLLLVFVTAMRSVAGAASPSGENPELAATVKMISAHATLRTPAVADPNSDDNLRMQEAMIRQILQSGPTRPTPPPLFAFPAAPLVGTLDGKFSVDNRGAANYDITLRIPESRADLGPSPSISYYSNGGSGILGEGFSFSTGFYRAITRGRTILARDDEVCAAELGPADHFYLDGKRLLCVSAPETYGKPGSVYRTEVDSFVEITALGTGEEIDAFRMSTKYGRLFLFGKLGAADDACHRGFDEATGRLDPRPMDYALKRVEDPLGNYVELTYEHKGFGDWVLASLAYTGGPDLAPAYTINLAYRPKGPRVPSYRALRRFDRNQLLELIRVRAAAGTAIVAEYQLAYEPVGDDGAYRLESIAPAFAADIGAPLEALPPTRFRWSANAAAPAMHRILPPAAATADDESVSALSDFDGDGKQDLLVARDGLQVALSSRAGFGGAATGWVDEATLARHLGKDAARSLQLGDFDGDGRTDAMLATAEGKLCFLHSTGSSFQPLCELDIAASLRGPEPATGASTLRRITLGDFNGDGRKDLLVHAFDGSLHLFLSNGSGFAEKAGPTAPAPRPTLAGATRIRALATDLNSDGLDDYIWLEETDASAGGLESEGAVQVPRRLCYALTMPDGTFAETVTLHTWPQNDTTPGTSALLTGDFNGDGLTDFLVGGRSDATPSVQDWALLLSRGHPTSLRTPTVPTVSRFSRAIPDSWTMPDGSQLTTFPSSHQLGASPTSPPATTPRYLLPPGIRTDNGLGLTACDVNQDGRDDFVWLNSPSPDSANPPTGSGPCWWVSLSNGDGSFAAPRRLTGIPWDEAARASTPSRPAVAGTPAEPVEVYREYDIDGDGLMDWTIERTGANGRRAPLAAFCRASADDGSCPFRNLVTAITDGRGSPISIAYKAAKDDAIYTPGAPVAYPIRELRASTPVVCDIWKDTTGDIPSQFTYRYAANRLDFAGRGGLGFNAFATLDQQTRFVKYQFLANSFPMTGLTVREQTFWSWQRNGTVWIKLISTEDNAVTFDAVVDPFTGRPWGTVHPFVSRTVESRWPSDTKGDYSYAAKSSPGNAGDKPLFHPLATPPSSRTTTSHWFDNQDPAEPPPTRCPEIAVPHILSAAEDESGRKPAPPAETLFPRKITYGNNHVTYVDLGQSFFTKETNTYRTPKGPEDRLTSLVETETSTKHEEAKDPVVAPIVSYNYFANTTLTERKVVNAEHASGPDPKLLTETLFARDSRGRVVQRRIRTLDFGKRQAGVTVETPYTASAFDDRLDLATDETDKEDGRMKSRYNPLFREWSEVVFESGTQSTAIYDALGRQTRVANTNGYFKTTEYAWTGPAGEGWRRMQHIRPPSGVTGLNESSTFAVRVAKKGSPTVTTYYDRTNRVIRVLSEDGNGPATFTDTVYNLLNQLVAESKPYTPDTAADWTLKRYDDYGRVLSTLEVGPSHSQNPQKAPPRSSHTTNPSS